MANTTSHEESETLALETIQLSKIYPPGVVAVNRLDLQIRQGIVHAIVGPNGAGKTTTLRLIGGLSRPNQGSIFIMGFDMLRDSWQAKINLGFLPDAPSAYGSLRVGEFLSFIGSLYQVRARDFKRRRREYVARFEISGFLDKYLGELSRGMLQRTLLCALLIRNPKVLLMDEPLYGLDPEGGYVLKQIIRELAQNGSTVLLSTHNLSVAEEVSDEFTIISKGSKAASGTVEELRREIGGGAALEDYYIRTLRGGKNSGNT